MNFLSTLDFNSLYYFIFIFIDFDSLNNQSLLSFHNFKIVIVFLEKQTTQKIPKIYFTLLYIIQNFQINFIKTRLIFHNSTKFSYNNGNLAINNSK